MNGAFQFATSVASGNPYAVTIKTQPVDSPTSVGVDKAEIQGIVSQYLQQQAEKGKAEGKKDPWYQVGTDLKMSANWKNGVLFSTPNDDFSLQNGSPCIDSGDSALTDADGSRSDMGAVP